MRDVRTGPKRPAHFPLAGAAALPWRRLGVPAPARCSVAIASAAAGCRRRRRSIADFYQSRDGARCGCREQAQTGRAADRHARKCRARWARSPDKYQFRTLSGALSARHNPASTKAVRRADKMLSEAFVDYVARPNASRPMSAPSMSTASCRHVPPSPRDYSRPPPARRRSKPISPRMRWMNPIYGRFAMRFRPRRAEAARATGPAQPRARPGLPAGERALYRRQFRRAAALHVRGWPVVDSMRVVVGKPDIRRR